MPLYPLKMEASLKKKTQRINWADDLGDRCGDPMRAIFLVTRLPPVVPIFVHSPVQHLASEIQRVTRNCLHQGIRWSIARADHN